ncbi:MAG: polysaccharide deacetylase family protein [Polyangiaceae bacterium]
MRAHAPPAQRTAAFKRLALCTSARALFGASRVDALFAASYDVAESKRPRESPISMLSVRHHPLSDFDRRIHNWQHAAKAVLGVTASLFPREKIPADDLLVVNFHSTPRRMMDRFEDIVRFLAAEYRLIAPSVLGDYADGRLPSDPRPSALITFDDGIENQYFAAKTLERHGIRGMFFVVPAFADEGKSEQVNYYRAHIRHVINPHIDNRPEDMRAMGWGQLRELRELGHEIGSHSYTHTIRVGNTSASERTREIVTSQKVIAERLGVEAALIRSFCAPVDPRLSIGVAEMALIKSHYQYFFTVFPGSNRDLRQPYAIRRVNLESFWMRSTIRYAVSRWEWYRWQKKASRYEQEVVGGAT